MYAVEREYEMSKVGETRLDDTQMECLIAAILTVASAGTDSFLPKSIVKRYSDLLEHLRQSAGTYINPSS